MKRVKLFDDRDPYYIQKNINKWQDEHPEFEILSVSSFSNNAGIVITIFYDDGTLPSFSQIK